MIMQIFRVQMGGHHHLIILTPHPICRFHADGMGLLRGDLTFGKALIAVVGHIAAQLAKPTLCCHHGLTGLLPGAVDSADIHPLIGFTVILGIAQGLVEVCIQILLLSGLIRIPGVVDDLLQPSLYRPESCRSQSITSALLCLPGRISSSRMSAISASKAASTSGERGLLQKSQR